MRNLRMFYLPVRGKMIKFDSRSFVETLEISRGSYGAKCNPFNLEARNSDGA